jgi:sec-independent protein translocase protein TatC
MPDQRKADDLFNNSSMTFAEHLEELRKALAKALVWLAIGMVISLTFAPRLIRYVQTPLENALNEYYHRKSIAAWEKKYATKMEAELEAWCKENRLIPEDYFVHRSDVLQQMTWANAPESELEFPKQLKLPGELNPKGFFPSRRWTKITTTTDALSMTEPFMIYLKAALVSGFVLASPFIFYHLWEFVAAGMYPHERKYVYFFLPTAVFLFLSGAAFAFYVIFEVVLGFLLTFNESLGIDASPRLTDYVSFALLMPLGFGIAFQLPLVMLILERLGILTVETYIAQWRVAILIIAFAAMVLTPSPDVTSMAALLLPLIALYFSGIGLCKWLPRSTALGAGGYDPK